MVQNLDTYAAGLRVERALVLKRAEFRAPLLDAARLGAAADPPPGAHGRPMPAGWGRLRRLALVGGLALGLVLPAVAAAHPHHVTTGNGEEQVIADGQNHGPFADGVSCGGDPAAYGLETAHHGPDAGTPGKGDGCYATTGGVPPAQDVDNPVIH
jgi:hypothetical protein